jgi:hypothetical protein
VLDAEITPNRPAAGIAPAAIGGDGVRQDLERYAEPGLTATDLNS